MATLHMNRRIAMAAALLAGYGTHAGAATLLLEFDAAAEGVGVTPTAISPAWTFSGGGNPEMVNNGSALVQDNTGDPVQQFGEYLSPALPAGTFTRGGATYGIEFRVRPLTDLRFIGGDWPEMYLTWSDDQENYNISVDLYGGGASAGTGDIVYGRNSFSPAITGIDWAQPHTIFIGHRGDPLTSSSVFDFYLDGSIVSTITHGSIGRAGNYARDAIGFGDGTSGGDDVAGEWYSVRVYDVASPSEVPEPTTFLMTAAGIFALSRRGRP